MKPSSSLRAALALAATAWCASAWAAAGEAQAWWIWPAVLFVLTFLLGIVAVIGGIGGGVLFVPIVGSFLPFHLDFVRGAGLVLALAGTLAAAPLLLRSQLANLRLVLPLALAGSVASTAGAVVGLSLPTAVVQTALGVTVMAVALLLWMTKSAENVGGESDALGELLRLRGEFDDPSLGRRIDWKTHRTITGVASFAGIGFFGGVFGLGAGFANVPALNLLMGAPLKVAVASSGLIISIINSSAAWVYINRGAVMPLVAVPSLLGISLGSRLGARLLRITPAAVVRRIVIVVMLIAGVRALLRGLGVWP
ncbi:MAG TPA: sulfite exporter TauE/SafE family protein [Burkholderiales bacterium]|nr:sulfite exporter TauE/SafE family protein [Burkholderiales bacterium]